MLRTAAHMEQAIRALDKQCCSYSKSKRNAHAKRAKSSQSTYSPTSRAVSKTLPGLARLLDCCAIRHEARFCLKVHEEKNINGEEVAEFEFLVSPDVDRNHQYAWQEGHILMQAGG